MPLFARGFLVTRKLRAEILFFLGGLSEQIRSSWVEDLGVVEKKIEET